MSEREDGSSAEQEEERKADTADELDAEIDSAAEEKMRDLLRGALGREPAPPPESDMLRGVQKRLRQRSRGKFYADEWSTAKQPPIGTYLVTSAIMLAIVVITYAILHYQSGEAVGVTMTPAPVHIVFPKTPASALPPAPPSSAK